MSVLIKKDQFYKLNRHFPSFYHSHPAYRELMQPVMMTKAEADDAYDKMMVKRRLRQFLIVVSVAAITLLVVHFAVQFGFATRIHFFLVPIACLLGLRRTSLHHLGDITAVSAKKAFWRTFYWFPVMLFAGWGAVRGLFWEARPEVEFLYPHADSMHFALTTIGLCWITLRKTKAHLPAITLPPAEQGPRGRTVLRGRQVATLEPIRKAAVVNSIEIISAETPEEARVHVKSFDLFGGVPIIRGAVSNTHKLLVGMSGSGKTTCLQMLMATMLPYVKPKHAVPGQNLIKAYARKDTWQAVVHDAKTENVPTLVAHGFVPRKSLFILNPFDARSTVWNMAEDIRSPSEAVLLAEMFLQSNLQGKNAEQHHYFRSNARRQITAVIQTFIHLQKGNPSWTLRDIINAFSSPDILRYVVSHHPQGQAVIEQTMKIAQETADGIFSSSTTYVDEFRILASLWHRTLQQDVEQDEITSLSLTRWVAECSESVLLLPYPRENAAIIGPLNRLLFQRITKLLLDSKYNKHSDRRGQKKLRRLVILDELPQLGRLDGLSELLTEGRSFGVEIVLGVQSYSQMVSAYGEADAKTILGQCAYKAFLKCDGDTAKWASQEIGQQIEEYSKMSYSYGNSFSTSGGTSTGGQTTHSSGHTSGWSNNTTNSREERIQDALFASELSGLPDPKVVNAITGYFLTPEYPVFESRVPFSEIERFVEPRSAAPPRVEVGSDNEWLAPWEDVDYVRLGLAPPKKTRTDKPHDTPSSKASPKASLPDLFPES